MGTRRLIVYRSGAGEEGVKNYFDTKDARGAKGRRIAFPVNRMGVGVCRPNYICIMATRLAIDRAVSFVRLEHAPARARIKFRLCVISSIRGVRIYSHLSIIAFYLSP